MKITVPAYVVGLVVAFVYGILKYYIPNLPFTEDQVAWAILVILSVLGIDVVNTVAQVHKALKAKGLL